MKTRLEGRQKIKMGAFVASSKLHHVSILTWDSGPVVDFYRDFLGFQVESHQEDRLLHLERHILKARDGERIEVIRPTRRDVGMSPGFKHLAFLVEDGEGLFLKLQAAGAVLPGKGIREKGGEKYFYARSPSGEFVKIIEEAK